MSGHTVLNLAKRVAELETAIREAKKRMLWYFDHGEYGPDKEFRILYDILEKAVPD